MAPPGPPPYTMEQINAMTSNEERVRARAELKSYIARMKREKREREMAGPGNHHYHPYQRPRPHYGPHKFKHRSVTFNNDSGTESSDANEAATASPKGQTAATTLCPALTSTGICSRHGCRYLHDSTKQALCKRWLYKGECPKGEFCDLPHESSQYNAPTCLHFQGDACNNDDCHFAHVRINPAAPNCEQFGRLGYCEKGNSCAERHAHECPSFSNTGTCVSGDRCRLGHVYRASRMRSVQRSSPVDGSPKSKTPEKRSDAPEDNEKETFTIKPGSVHEFTQQDDFVPFDADD